MRAISLSFVTLLFSCQEPQQIFLDNIAFGSLFRLAVDLDADGRDEILVSSSESLSIFSAEEGGAYTISQTIPGAGSARPRDINEDGVVDLVVPLEDALDFETFKSGPAVELLLNNGRNEFSTFGPFFLDDPSNFIDLADIDGDGLSDIIFLRELRDDSDTTIGAEIVTRRNDGFLFGPEEVSPLIGQEADEVRILSFLARDLDDDGVAEVVAQISLQDNEPGPTAEKLFIAENDGAGNFVAPTEIDLATNFYTILAGDVDGDQDLDLIQNFSDELGVRALLNDGNNQFTALDLGLEESLKVLFSLEDLDQDGAKEIIVESGSSNRRSALHIFSFANGGFSQQDVSLWHEDGFLLSQVKDLNDDGLPEAIYESNVDEIPESVILIYPSAF